MSQTKMADNRYYGLQVQVYNFQIEVYFTAGKSLLCGYR